MIVCSRPLPSVVRGLLIALVAGSLTGCGNRNQELIDSAPLISETYQDALGQELKLPRVPGRIVSLAPNITEMIYALGKGDHMVARSHVCDYPDAAFDLPEITTFPSLDLPSIVAYEPDLVLASGEIHGAQVAESFESLRVPFFYQSYDSLGDIYRQIRMLGAMLHTSQTANQLADSLKRLENTIADSTKNEIHYGTVILVGTDPITVAGSRSFLNDMLQKCGGKNVFASREERYPTITAQELVKAQPEFILIPSGNDQAYQELLARYPELHTQLPAAVNNHVFMLDPSITVRPGPRIIEGMVAMTRALHPRIDLVELLD